MTKLLKDGAFNADTYTEVADDAALPEGPAIVSLARFCKDRDTLLARNVPITDVAQWLGHRDINETYRTYGHLVPSAAARAVSVLDAEYAAWSVAV